VINLVGILAERKAGDFTRLQAEGAGRIARLAKDFAVRHLVHVSAIGADQASPASYARSKAEGERLVQENFPQAVILRPSLVFGPEDQFFNRFASLALVSPVMPVISGGSKFQPVYVGDVADAAMAAVARPDAAGKIYELGGPKIMTFREILGWILAQIQRNRPLVPMPPAAAELMARIPFSGLTHDQLLMLARDNVANPALPGLAALGVVPTPIDLIVPAYLARYRRGGLKSAA
jgi:NADH dehydrogenase